MKYLVLFEDNPGVGTDVRSLHMAAHRQFLADNSDNVDAAGPLHESDGSNAGGAWVVEGDSESEVERLIKEDPFWPTGLRKSYRILQWTQVFANGQVTGLP